MKAIIIGATGVTGKALVRQLLADEQFSRVTIFVRKPTEFSHTKLVEQVIDFDRPEQWRDSVQGDVLFSCLGTTMKAAGSRAAQWKTDYEYQYRFAQTARQNGVEHYVLVSSVGADAGSRAFYTRMKGRLDDAVRQLDFPHAFILRPPSLIRPNTDRLGEKISLAAIRLFNSLGLFEKYRPMRVATLASAMRQAVKKSEKFAILESEEIRRIAA